MKDNSFKSNYKQIEYWLKRLYVWAVNFYTWFWIIRQIFWRKSTDLESYLLWFFLAAGMYFFIRESKDLDIIYNIDEDKKENLKSK
ncbi:hypothetical protein [Flavivirga jejuensis]|uniref:2TM domain-containing protein n=1 Tax=Flavivirga jejuensis TaxID=870487 RepID=A0ABT8WVA0_9FLAO|nr:hypothetical protein [Flavivirga jejuensis]MDO5977093.1 hypothetical protein [Flavivirga jejuensis]